MKNPNLQILVDTLVIETLLADPRITKRAEEEGMGSTIFNTVKSYVSGMIDKEHPISSVLAILTPGILTAIGLPVGAFLVFLAETVFNLDLAAIFSSIGQEISSLISGGHKIDDHTADAIVAKSVNANSGTQPTEADLAKVDNLKVASVTLAEAKLFNRALGEFIKANPNFDLDNPKLSAGLFVQAGPLSRSITTRLLTFIGVKSKMLKLLAFVVGWIVKAVLVAAGYAGVGAAYKALVPGGEKEKEEAANKGTLINLQGLPATSSQKVYPVSPSYQPEVLNNKYNRWIVQGSPSNIGNLIVSWALDVYPDLRGKESAITASRNFQTVVKIIEDYNDGNVSGMTFIPFRSRKDLVDKFIDEVASHGSPTQPGKNPPLSI